MKKLLIYSPLFVSASFIIPALLMPTAKAETFMQRQADPIEFERTQVVKSDPRFAKIEKLPTPQAKAIEIDNPLEMQVNQAIVEQQWAVLKPLLERYQQQADYDQTLVDYGLGALFYAQKNYPKAIWYYQQVLKQKPNLAYPRFDLAVMLFEDRQFRQAKAEFEQALPNLDPTMQRLALRYLKQMQEWQHWQPDLSLQYTQTSNVNNAADSDTIELGGRSFVKDQESRPQSAHGVRYGLGLEREVNVAGHHFIGGALRYNGVYYWDNQPFNEQTLNAELNYHYRTAKYSVGLAPFIEQNWYGSPRYSYNFGVQADYNRQLSERWSVSVVGSHQQKRYFDELNASRYNGFQNRGSATLSWQLSNHWRLFAGIELNNDRVKEKASSSHKTSGRFGVSFYQQNWGTQWQVKYANRSFADKHYLYGYKRQDKELLAQMSLWHKALIWQGIVPKLHLRYEKIKSNMPDFYSRHQTEWFITLEKSF